MVKSFAIGHWTFVPDLHLLRRSDGTERRLEPKQTEVLLELLEHENTVVSKADLLDTVWSDVCVNEEVLTNTIYQLRRALGDSARTQTYIRTVPKKGYLLVSATAATPRRQRRLVAVRRMLVAAALIALAGAALLIARGVSANAEIEQASSLIARGEAALRQSHSDADLEALRAFEAAVAIDPRAAEAWSGLARARLELVSRGDLSSTIGLPLAETAARRAIEIDPQLARPWTTLGLVRITQWRWSEAEKAIRRAIELEPGSGEPHAAMAQLLLLTNRLDGARAEIETARQLSPSSRTVLLTSGFVFTMLRDDRAAVDSYRAILRDHPDDPVATSQLRKLEERQLQRAEPEISAARVDQLLRKQPLRPAIVAGMFAEAGEDERALEWLRRARDEKDLSLLLVRLDDRWTRLHENEEYRAILDDAGL